MCHVITLGVFQKFFLDDVNFYSVCILTFVNMTNLTLIWLVLNFSYFNHILLNFSMVEAEADVMQVLRFENKIMCKL